MAKKPTMATITIRCAEISVIRPEEEDYISHTDIAIRHMQTLTARIANQLEGDAQ